MFSLTPDAVKTIFRLAPKRQKMIATYLPAMDNLPHNGPMAALLFGASGAAYCRAAQTAQETGVAVAVVAISAVYRTGGVSGMVKAGTVIVCCYRCVRWHLLFRLCCSVCAAVVYGVWLAGFAVPPAGSRLWLLLVASLRWWHSPSAGVIRVVSDQWRSVAGGSADNSIRWILACLDAAVTALLF